MIGARVEAVGVRAELSPNYGEIALAYARRGWPVHPLRKADKLPATAHGCKDATTDEQQIRRWWKQWPEANIGLATGYGWWVLDIDPDGLAWAEANDLPATTEATTGRGGRHLLYRLPDGVTVRNSAGMVAPGVDVRGIGGYIVAAPSLHPSGTRYTWLDCDGDVPDGEPADAPAWLLDMVAKTGAAASGQAMRAPTLIQKGVQHHTLFKYACSLWARGDMEPEEIAAAAILVSKRCEDVPPEANVHAIVRDVCQRYQRGRSPEFETRQAVEVLRDPGASGDVLKEVKPKVQPSKKVNGLKVAQSDHPPTVFLFENFIYNGLTVLAGRPKQGKSWMALQLAIDAAMGRPGLAKFPACRGPQGVLYYGLEEKEPRTKNRLAKLTRLDEPLLQNIQFIYELLPLMGGGLEVIEADLKEQHYGLVIIDTLFAALGGLGRKRNVDIVADDYHVVKSLQSLAQKYETAMLLIHHTRKAGADNSIDKVQGTTGITAGPDAVWVLDRGPRCTTLDISPRDMEAAEYAVHMNTDEQAFGWSVKGDADEARTSEARWEILDLLGETPEPMTPNDIAKSLRKNRITVRRLLSELRKSGHVSKLGTGYRLSK